MNYSLPNNSKTKEEFLCEYLLYIVALISIIEMSFYIYIKNFIPILPYIKDSFLLLILPLLLLYIISSSFKIRKLNHLDKIIFCLFSYLIVQFFRTGLELSFAAAYSGFRLTFMYIILYFLFKSISNKKLLGKIDKAFYIICICGISITFLEALFIKTGLVSIHTLDKIMVVNRYSFQEYNRVYGITGSIHITGVYNCIFFSILLFGLHLKRSNKKLKSILLIEKIQSLKSNNLLIFSFLAVIISMSRTAWTCMALIIILYAFSYYKFKFKYLIHVAITVGMLIIIPIFYFDDTIYTTYISFLFEYGDRVLVGLSTLFDSFWFGSGYHVGQTAVGVDWSMLTRNYFIYTDFFFLDIFSSLGIVGIFFYYLLFCIIPFSIIISKKYSYEIKVISAPILVAGIAFGHYNPLQIPCVNIFIWYLFVQLSNMLTERNNLSSKMINRL